MAVALLAAVGTAAAGVGAVAVSRSGEALPGTTVSGVDVAGLDRAEIVAAIDEPARARTQGTLEVVVGDERVPVERAPLTGDLDLQATAEQAIDAGRTGYPLAQVIGPVLPVGERSVELEVDVDERAVRERVEQLAAELDAEPHPGGFTVDGTTVTAVQPETGIVLDQDEAVARLEEALQEARTEPLELPAEVHEPLTTAEDVRRVTEQARRALAAPYRLTAGEDAIEVTPAQIAPMLGAEVVEDDLQLRVDLDRLNELVAGLAADIDRPARDARFHVPGSPPRVDAQGDLTWTPRAAEVVVRPAATGRDVDVDAATARLAELVLAGERETELPMRTTEPEVSTRELEQAGVTQLIGTFTTYYTAGQPRAQNIARIAEIVDGTYVAPGKIFSLNREAGRRTRERGFVADGVIIDGELEDQVGGGVSQFATTMFNAAFFAGLPILEHKPHSFYISRYPAGRESTLFFGAIDVKWRNDTGNGIYVAASTTRSSVTVALYGDNGGRRVTADHGPRRPREGGGFSIEVTRTISGGDTRVFRTSYDPPPEEDA